MNQENSNVNMNPGTGSESLANPSIADNVNLSGNQPFYFPQGNPRVVLSPVNTQNSVSLSTPQIDSVPHTNLLDRVSDDGEEISDDNFHDASDFIHTCTRLFSYGVGAGKNEWEGAHPIMGWAPSHKS